MAAAALDAGLLPLVALVVFIGATADGEVTESLRGTSGIGSTSLTQALLPAPPYVSLPGRLTDRLIEARTNQTYSPVSANMLDFRVAMLTAHHRNNES